MIEGIKRNATTYVGDSIVRKTDARLNKVDDVVVCLPGGEFFFPEELRLSHYLVWLVRVKV